jgi:LacI family transcriptional regulator
VFDPDVLAGALEELSPAYHGVAVIALDHPRVRAAIDDLAARGVAVVTLVSDAPSARRLHYVGIDNPAAGRTASTLMGRFLSGAKAASPSSQDRCRCAITPSGNSAFTRF